MEKHFLVTWQIDVWASDHVDAAIQARKIQLDPNSLATFFTAKDCESGEQFNVDTITQGEEG